MENPDASACWWQAMRSGDFDAAWAISDAVLAGRDPATRDDPALPYHLRWVWDGRPFDRRRVLVRCYHGLGDTLQFCRYLPLLRRRVAHLTLEAQPELVPLLRTLPGLDRLLPFRPEAPAPASECDIEIMELAHALRQRPSRAPYLSAGAGLLQEAGRPRRNLRVGLCWRAGGWDTARSVPLAALAPLGQAPGVRLVNLQRGPGLEEANEPGAPGMSQPQDGDGDMLATARVVAGLDLVVTVDTVVAHLAGALGRPTWLLLQADADWRWMAGRRDSPWYGSVRLYRQRSPGDWAPPLAELRSDLAAFARNRLPGNPEAVQGL